jgi:hypothetical protein
MARYIINDDDVEAWIVYLEIENKQYNNEVIAYVIDQMKEEVEYNQTRFRNNEQVADPEEWKTPSISLKPLSLRNSFALFLADYKARENS